MFVSDPTIDLFLRGLVLTALAMVWVVALVRVNGLRSFSKMTAFDFVMTVAMGSLLAGAGQATDWTGFLQIVTAMAALFAVQHGAARLRSASAALEALIQNEPVILMRDGEIIESALTRTRVGRDDLVAKLREANVLDFSDVRAVVLETTGDISVLHGDHLADETLLSGVRNRP